jgi:hypothetical protein
VIIRGAERANQPKSVGSGRCCRNVCESLANLARKTLQGEGLLQETRVHVDNFVFENDSFGVSRDKHHLHVRVFRAENFAKLTAAHSWHDHIGDHEIDAAGELAGDVDGLESVWCFDDGVSEFFPELDGRMPDGILVFDEKKSLGSAQVGLGRCLSGVLGSRRSLMHAREVDLEGGSAALKTT